MEAELTNYWDPIIDRMNERMENILFSECETLGISNEEPARMRSALPEGTAEGGVTRDMGIPRQVTQAAIHRMRDL